MKEVLASLPVVRALRALDKRRDRRALALALLITGYAMVSLLTPGWRGLQRALMEAHHMRPSSLARWVVLQPAPKMYGFAHRAWLGQARIGFGPRFEREHFWVNHYPARRARFDGARGRESTVAGPRYLYLRSSYRGVDFETSYEVRFADGTVRIRSMDVKP